MAEHDSDADAGARRRGHGNAAEDARGYRSPKELERDDEAIGRDVCETLDREDSLDARHVTATVQEGTVTLEGWVWSPQQRDLVAALIADVLGVSTVHDRLECRSPHDA